jgi:hypothetical protein
VTGATGLAGATGATGAAGAAGPAGTVSHRAGSVTLSTSSSNTTVTFSTAMASASYTVQLTMTGAPNFGTSSGWGYLQATSKGTASFVISLRNSNGSAQNAPSGTTIDWIVVPNQ